MAELVTARGYIENMKKEQLIEKAKELYKYFDSKDDGYHPDHYTARMFEVNVKIHKTLADVSEVLDKYPKKYHERIIEEFNDERISGEYGVYWTFMEDIQRNALDMVKSQGSMQAMDAKAWQKYAGDALDKDIPTGYPAIDELKTKEAKRKMLQSFIDSDKEILDAFSIIDVTKRREYKETGPGKWLHPEDPKDKKIIKNILKLEGLHPDDEEKFKDSLEKNASVFGRYKQMQSWTETNAGFYGRMGGHFCFDIDATGIFDNIEEELQSTIDWEDPTDHNQKMNIKDAHEIIKNAEDVQAKIQFIKNWVEEEVKNLPENWKAELEYRIEEYIEELKEEDKKAKDPDITSTTLGQLLTSRDEVIKRHATGILKQIQRS